MEEINLVELDPKPKKFLLIGREGSGKTKFIASMPKPICVFSFDKGVQTLAGEDGIKAFVFMDNDRYHPKAWLEFKQQFQLMKEGKLLYNGKEPYKTIAIDSLTALSKFILDHANYVNQTIDAKTVGYTPYTHTKSYLQDTVVSSVYAAEYVVCTALLEANKDELTGQMFFNPSTEGKFREEAGQWFDVVGYMQVDIDNTTKKPVFSMDVVGDRAKKAKIRLPSLKNVSSLIITDPTFEKITQLASKPTTSPEKGK